MEAKQKWIVSHVGAREHYAVSRALNKNDLLDTLYTDIWIPGKSELTKSLPKALKKISSRYHSDLQNQIVKSYSVKTLLDSTIDKFSGKKNIFDHWISIGSRFSSRVVKSLETRQSSGKNIHFGYTCGNLEILEYLQKNELFSIHDQIDPGFIYYEEKEREWNTYPFAEDPPSKPCLFFEERIKKEWDLAKIILVNSTYSKTCLILQGVKSEKIIVVPLCYENSSSHPPIKNFSAKKSLNILWVGNINLIKGFYYFFEAAKKLPFAKFNFKAAGTIGLSNSFFKEASRYISFTGHLHKEAIQQTISNADILVFPTLSDGFGMVQLEAMAAGVPVISTYNCGEVVSNGVDGYKIDPRNSDQIIEKLELIYNNRELLAYLSTNAIEKAKSFSLDTFIPNLKKQESISHIF